MQTFPRPHGKPAFTAPWFLWFATAGLELPEGSTVRMEGHTILMSREFFAPPLVHLLVVIPKNNMKTVWEALVDVWHMLTIPAPRVYMGAADKEQARELFGFEAHFIRSEPEIEKHLLVRDSTLEIRRRDGTGLAKVLASDDSRGGGKRQGKNFTKGGIDELHAHENDNLFTDFRSAGFKRRDAAKVAGLDWWWQVGKLATVTTETHDSESVLAREMAKFLGDPERGVPPMGTVQTDMRVLDDGTVVHDPINGRLTIARYGDGRNVMLRWAARETDDREDDETTKLCNPASTVTVESLKDARESLTPWSFDRYRRNLRTLGFESWLPIDAWPALRSDDVPQVAWQTWEGATLTGAVDDRGDLLLEDVLDDLGAVETAALTDSFREYVDSLYAPDTRLVGAVATSRFRDVTAVVLLGRNDAGLKVPRTIMWRSKGQNAPIAHEWVKAGILAVNARYDLAAFAYNPKHFATMAEEIEDDVAVEPWPQSPERMGPADTDLRAEIVAEVAQFAHDGDPYLTAHIQAGAAKDVGPDLLMVTRQSGANPPPIAACKALSMANALEKVADDDGDEPLGAWA